MSSVLRSVGAGGVVGIIAVVFAVSFGTVIFSGSLVEFRGQGIGLILTGSLIYGCASLVVRSPDRSWWTNQTAPAVLMAVSVASVQQSMAGADINQQFASASLVIALSTFASGAAMLAIGTARLAQIAKFIPYPVIGGFLAATGIFLLLRAAMLPLGAEAEIRDLVALENTMSWLPFLLVAALIAFLDRWVSPGGLLLVVIMIYLPAFNIYLAIAGMDVQDARAAGLLLEANFDTAGLSATLSAERFASASFVVVLGEWPLVLATAALACLSLLMSTSAIEYISSQPTDLNREMRRAGIANLICGIAGGAVGHVSASMHGLARQIAPEPSRWLSLAGTSVIGFFLLTGSDFVSAMPVGLLTIVLGFAGFQIIFRWLLAGTRELPFGDYVILILITGSALLVDLTLAVGVGMVAAVMRFALAYARIDIVRSQVSGALRLSQTERSEPDTRIIQSRGHETLIYELQGFLFFGTANSLLDRIVADIERTPMPIRNVVVDFRRVGGMDVSMSFIFKRLLRFAAHKRVRLIYTGLGPAEAALLAKAGAMDGAEGFATIADALSQIEERVLAEAKERSGATRTDLEQLLEEADAAGLPLASAPEAIAPGQVVFSQGQTPDCLVYLMSGRLAAMVTREDGGILRVSTFLPGAIAGEIGFLTGEPRTATIVAEEPGTIRLITAASLAEVAREIPEFSSRFNRLIALSLARRLGRTTALFVAMDR